MVNEQDPVALATVLVLVQFTYIQSIRLAASSGARSWNSAIQSPGVGLGMFAKLTVTGAPTNTLGGVSVSVGALSKMALTVLAASMVTLHVAVPVHAPPQPSNTAPALGKAVSVTT